MTTRKLLTFVAVSCLSLVAVGSVTWAQHSTTRRPTTHTTPTRPTTTPTHRTTTRPTPQPTQPATPAARVLITVNGSPIDEAHFRKAIEDKWGKPVLDDIINDRLVRQEARARNIKVTTAEIDAAVAQERAEFPAESEFLAMLENKGYTLTGFRHDLETKLLLDRLIAEKANITDAEVQKYYDAHKAEYVTPGKIHLYDIETNTPEDAYQARQRLAKNEAFATVAAEMSSDKETAQKGGERGWLSREEISDPVLSEAAFSMRANDVSNPIQVGGHYHVLYVKELQPEKATPVRDVQAAIVAKLRAEKGLSPDDYVAALARKATVKVAWTPFKYMEAVYTGLKAIQILIDGQRLQLAEHPIILPNGTMMIPAKPALSAAHIQMTWNSGAQQLIAATKAVKVVMTVGSPTASVITTTPPATRPLTLPEGPQLRSGHLYIPPRAIIDALGGKVDWDAGRNAVIIRSPGAMAGTAVPILTPAPTPTPSGSPLPPGEGGTTAPHSVDE